MHGSQDLDTTYRFEMIWHRAFVAHFDIIRSTLRNCRSFAEQNPQEEKEEEEQEEYPHPTSPIWGSALANRTRIVYPQPPHQPSAGERAAGAATVRRRGADGPRHGGAGEGHIWPPPTERSSASLPVFRLSQAEPPIHKSALPAEVASSSGTARRGGDTRPSARSRRGSARTPATARTCNRHRPC